MAAPWMVRRAGALVSATCRACPCRTPEDLPCDCACHGPVLIPEIVDDRRLDDGWVACEKHDSATYPLDDEEREP